MDYLFLFTFFQLRALIWWSLRILAWHVYWMLDRVMSMLTAPKRYDDCNGGYWMTVWSFHYVMSTLSSFFLTCSFLLDSLWGYGSLMLPTIWTRMEDSMHLCTICLSLFAPVECNVLWYDMKYRGYFKNSMYCLQLFYGLSFLWFLPASHQMAGPRDYHEEGIHACFWCLELR